MLEKRSNRIQIIDDQGAQVVSFGSPTTLADKFSPVHFTAAYYSTGAITLSALGFTITDSSQVIFIKAIDATAKTTKIYIQGNSNITLYWDSANSRVAIYENGTIITALNANMVFQVGVASLKTGEDNTNDITKINELSPLWSRYTSPENLISAAQDLTDAWADLGGEVDTQGYPVILVGLNIDINNSLNVRFRMLKKFASAGTNEYKSQILTVGTSDIKAEDEYIEFNVDADGTPCLAFATDGAPYVQFQVMAGTVGATAGQIDGAEIVKTWIPK